MRAREFLVEYYNYDVDKMYSRVLKDNSAEMYEDVYGDFYALAQNLPEWLAQHDPTQNNKYVNWMLVKYLKGGIQRLEDVPAKIAPALELYSRLALKKKLEPEHKDINRFKGTDDLLNVYDYYRQKFADEHEDVTASKKEKAKSIEQEMYDNGDAELLFNDSEYKIVIPVSHRASCFFGKNTRWCTTSEHSTMYHEQYSRKGPLIIILHKPTNSRWQFHHESNQFMDEEDHQINLKAFFEEHPKMIQFFLKWGKNEEGGVVEVIGKNEALLFGQVPVTKSGELISFDDLSNVNPQALPKVVNSFIKDTGYEILDIRGDHVIIQKWPDIVDAAEDLENATAEWMGDSASFAWALGQLQEGDPDIDVHDADIDGFFTYHITPELDDIIEEAVKRELAELGVEYDEDDETTESLFNMLKDEEGWSNSVVQTIEDGVRYGVEAGYYDELSKDTWGAIESFVTEYGGHFAFKGDRPAFDTEVFLIAPIKDFLNTAQNDEYFKENLEYDGWFHQDFLEGGRIAFVEQPRYGWHGFSEDAAKEHIMSELKFYLSQK